MKAVILAGGFATRLRPLSCTRPKTLFPIVNKPLLQWIYERLSKNGVSEAILAVNQLTEFHIRQQQIPKSGLTVKYSHDPPRMPLGTAGPIKKAEKLIGRTEPFLVLNGDVFADLSYKKIIERHIKKDALATIALCKVEDPSRYGVAELAENGRIKRFIEKPPRKSAPSNLINAGVYVLNPKVFQLIPEGRAVSMEREIFPKIVEQEGLFGYFFQGLWMDIGKPEEYLETNRILLDLLHGKKMPQGPHNFTLKAPVAMDKGVSVGENSVIGPHVVLGKNVQVGKDVKIKDSVVFLETKIGDSAYIEGAIIGEGAVIGKKARIGKGCIIADLAKVKDGVCLEEEVAVCPSKEVAEKTLKSKIVS
jgi:mannose-1-phosphate guanylyltransferase